MRLCRASLLLLLIVSLAACAPARPAAEQDGLVVTVSIEPQAYFCERIAGDLVTVTVMVPPGASPATYEPTPAQLRALGASSAYFSVGVPFEQAWMARITAANPDIRIIDTGADIARRTTDEHTHDDDEIDKEQEQGADPHIWTSPELVRKQATVIKATLVELDPENASVYEANCDVFLADISQLQAALHKTLDPLAGSAFMVFHPSWGYFADEYGLEQIAIEVGGQEPSAQELAALIDEAKHEGIQVVFAQPEFDSRSAQAIADEIGGEVILISPLAHDWLENMQTVAEAFSRAATAP